jgi:hypothetical protein
VARAFRAPTITELHTGLCETIANAPKDKLDVITSVDVQIHNVIAEAASMEWDFDLKDMWLTKARWSMMLRQYLEPEDLVTWLNKTANVVGWNGRGVSLMRTKVVKPRGGGMHGNKETRRWGSCMIAISYKALPAPQITLYSRTSYLGYLAGMDITVAWMCGRYLAELLGRNVEDIKFVWLNEAMQYHNFKSLAYFLNHRDDEKRVAYRMLLCSPEDQLTDAEKARIAAAPALHYSRKWVQKALTEDARGQTLGDISYNTYRRIKRRFHTEVMGYEYAKEREGWSVYKKGPKEGEQREFFKAYEPLPHVPITELNFTPLGLPSIDRISGMEYDEGVAQSTEEEDDDDDE